MARARFIRPEFYEDDKIGSLSFPARLLFPRTWMEADMQGVFEWNAKIFRIKAFPHDENVKSDQVEKWMGEIVTAGMVEFFEHNGKKYGFIPKFCKHQSFTTSEVKAGNRHPSPPHAVVPGRSCDQPENDHGGTEVRPESDGSQSEVRRESPSLTLSPSPSPSPAVALSPDARKIPPTPPKNSNREALAKCLRRLGLRATEDSMGAPGTITEWADLMQGRGMCRTPEQVLQGIRWIVEQAKIAGVECKYAKHAPAYADRWGKMMAKAIPTAPTGEIVSETGRKQELEQVSV